MRVGLIGKGDRFDSLVYLLRDHDVFHWHGAPRGEDGEVELPAHVRSVDPPAFDQTPLIFISLPMTQLRRAAHQLGHHITARHVVVHTTRSLEPHSEMTGSDVLAHELHTQRLGFATGPFRAEDVLAGRGSSMVCASAFPEVLDLVADALASTHCRVYRSDDLRGAEVSAAYARLIAMIYGVARQMNLGSSLEATLFARGLAEMGRVAAYLGGHERTAFGLAGCGNLRSDTAEAGSLDHQLGQAFVRHHGLSRDQITADFGSVGLSLLDLLDTLAPIAQRADLDTHIIDQASAVISRRVDPALALAQLIDLPTFHE